MSFTFKTIDDCAKYEIDFRSMKTPELNNVLNFVCTLGLATTHDHRFVRDAVYGNKGVDGRQIAQKMYDIWLLMDEYIFIGVAAMNMVRVRYPQYLKERREDLTPEMVEQRAREMALEMLNKMNNGQLQLTE